MGQDKQRIVKAHDLSMSKGTQALIAARASLKARMSAYGKFLDEQEKRLGVEPRDKPHGRNER